jgi:hypothetical protein
MATLAVHVAMRTLQSKRRLLFVVEQSRFPLHAVVTSAALRNSGLGKLRPVRIGVTRFAPGARCLEVSASEAGFRIQWFVAIRTLCGLVRPEQRKRRVRVIEMREIVPYLGGVATLTSRRLSIGASLVYQRVESSLMRIGVTGRATHPWPVILRRRFWFET